MKLLVTTILSLNLFTSATGCSKKSDCEAVFDHIVSILPAEMKSQMADGPGREKGLAKCEKMTAEERTCALEAKSLADLANCSHK
jgi:hypothetical protein